MNLPSTGDEKPDKIKAYYDDVSKDFWIENKEGNYMRINEGTLQKLLIRNGFDKRAANGAVLSEVDDELVSMKFDNHVSYAGPLAGHMKGVYPIGGKKVLVTSSPEIIQPKEGEFPLLSDVLEKIFQDELDWFLGWIKVAFEGLYSGKFRPGQVLAMAGPRKSGKTLMQALITKILGGREEKPWSYFIGATDFNSELFAAEHLAIGDEIGKTDIGQRREFGARIKQLASERVHRCHKKGREAISMSPFWRCSVTLNIEDENLIILPPLDEDHLKDKVMLLRAWPNPMPMPTNTREEEMEFMAALTAELPGFLAWLIELEIPEEMQDSRMGIATHRNEDLLAALRRHSPEEVLWNLVLHCVSEAEWKGSSQDLEDALLAISPNAARRIFSFSSACEVYLRRLEGKADGRVVKMLGGSRHWKLVVAGSEGAQ